MSDRPLGVCVVGNGFMGTIHAERWQAHPAARVLAVADVDAARAEALAARVGARAFTDYRAALDWPEVNVASVCLPTHLHAEAALAAMERGRHVLSEKPIALTLPQAEAMIAGAARHRVKFAVGFMRRHSPVVEALRAFLAEGRLGRPVLYEAHDVRELRPKRLMHDADGNGGPVIDMAVHLFDLWLNLFASPPVSVAARGLTLAAARPEIAHIARKAVDSAALSVRFASGDLGSFVVSWGLPPGANPPQWPDRVYGARGLVEAEYQMRHQSARWLKEGGEWETIADSTEDMYQREIDAFANVVLHGAGPRGTGDDGLAALRLAHAALESIRTGESVSLA